eukprot:40417-Lingulodinium_polyedra.AAC.1
MHGLRASRPHPWPPLPGPARSWAAARPPQAPPRPATPRVGSAPRPPPPLRPSGAATRTQC